MIDWSRVIVNLVITATGVLLAVVVYDAIGAARGPAIPASGVVIDRQYQAGQTWTSYDGNRVSVHSTPDAWHVIVRTDDGEALVADTSIGMWAMCPAGTRVDLARRCGPLGLVRRTSLVGPARDVEARSTWNH